MYPMRMSYKVMNRAKADVDDEWYTRLEDIEKEIPQHASQLRNKTVICPCDHPRKSRFYQYLKANFHKFGLKSLICSHYEEPRSYVIVYDGKTEHRHDLNGNGDFCSPEVLMWTRRADVIVTNPPFSLIREWMDYIMPMGIKYLFVCPFYAMAYVNVFEYAKRGKVFFIPHWVKKFDNNPKRLGNTGWITNLPTGAHPPIPLKNKYAPDEYEFLKGKWAGILHVPRLSLVPYDFYGHMAVPTTILYKINYSQFKILGLIASPGKGIFKRVVIKRVR